ncbi:hypothetical protein R1flu_012189 [Riccia fluitans]|uniref:Uncharacterized protein n=1 Tax=Riccia fluitans TaxID=41844 RepID=A0ABD1ZD78_9MARC
MDGNGQQVQEAQRQMMDQQQQGGWYGAAQHNPYHVPYKWPPHDSSMQHYAQPPGQPYGQPEYYLQPQQYAPTLHQTQTQQTHHPGHMYVQQEQVWSGNNGWTQPQSSYQATGTGSEEEDWAAKARAWAAAKAAQEAAHQAQLQAQAQAHAQTLMSQPEQQYQDYQQQPQPAHHGQEAGRTPNLQPPGQEASHSFSQDTTTGFGQEADKISRETTAVAAYGHEDAPPSYPEEGAPSAYTQAGQAQVVPSSYSQDVSSSYGQDTAHAAPPGTEQLEQSNLQLPRPPPATVLQQQQQSQPSPVPAPHVPQTQPFSYQDPAQAPFDYHQHQQFDFQQPSSQDYQQQPSAPYIPPAPSLGLESSEMNFGGLPNGMPVWPPLGGPGISYPPVIGPGGPGSLPGSQFDHSHHTHPSHHTHSMHGHHPPNMFPRPHGPPHGPGFRPAGPPLGVPFGFGGSPSLGQGPGAGVGPVFLPDNNGNIGAPDRPKKPPVPSWLREELLKKKAVGGTGTSNVVTMPENITRANGTQSLEGSTQKLGAADRTRSDSSGPSDNEEDDEDEVETARIAQMNHEIKRVLTEVLLKVTDDLFDEIAQEVIDEDEEAEEGHHQKISAATEKEEVLRSNSSPSPPAAPSLIAPARVLVPPARRNNLPSEDDSDSMSSGAPVVNVLGLASYASDDEDGERVLKHNSISVEPEATDEIPYEKGQAEKKTNAQKSTRASEEDSKFAERKSKEVKDVTQGDKDKNEKKEMESGKDTAKRDGVAGRKDNEKEKEEMTSKVANQERDKKEGGRDRREKKRDHAKDSERRMRDKAFDSDEHRREFPSDPNSRKRLNDENTGSDKDVRSPRRARHGEAERTTIISDQPLVEKTDSDISRRQSNTGTSRNQAPNDNQGVRTKAIEMCTDTVEERGSSAGHGLGISRKESNKGDAKLERHAKESKPQGNDEVGAVSSGGAKGRAESGDIPSRKSKEAEGVNKEHERAKHRNRDGDREHDGKSERSKGKSLDKERDRDSDKVYNKEKLRDSERAADRERSKSERGRDRGRTHERERRKGEKDRSDRGRERRKDSRESKRNRRRSTSASSRGRSPSSSRCSSSGDDRSRSPHQRKFGRSSRRHSVSRSPVKVRKRCPPPAGRSSRSRSRSPPSKYSHRRHSPSPSRESDRHR